MGNAGRKLLAKLQSTDDRTRRTWYAITGVAVMAVFVVSSVLVNQTVLALNQAAGNYGYRSGSYGYSASTTSDKPPSAPASFACSTPSTGTGNVACSWTAVSLTTDSTSYDNHDDYEIYYATSSANATSSLGTKWDEGNDTALGTRTTSSTTITGLTGGTLYYFTIYALDANANYSAASSTVSATALASAGGGGGGGGGGGSVSIFATPATPASTTGTVAVPATPPSVANDAATLVAHLVTLGISTSRDTAAEAAQQTRVTSSATEFSVTLSAEVRTVATNFATYGTNAVTAKLGSGERLAVVRDVFETLGNVIQSDAAKLLKASEEISSGQKPSVRNLAKEQAQVSSALAIFRKLTGRSAPNFKNAKDDLAWNTLLYRVRFTRDLAKERAGITKFRSTFGKTPRTPQDWAGVRAWAYALQ